MFAGFHTELVLLSTLTAAMVSYLAFVLAGRMSGKRNGAGTLWLTVGAVALGAGAWATHFIGMLAWQSPIPLTYDPWLTLGSLVIAVLTCWYSLRTANLNRLHWPSLVRSGLVLGAGVAAVHYVAMAAISIQPGLDLDATLVTMSLLVGTIASFFALALVAGTTDLPAWKLRLRRVAAALTMAVAVGGLHYIGISGTRIPPGAWCSGGFVLDPLWFAVTLALIAFGLLTLIGLLTVVDHHMASRTRRHAEQLEEANARLRYAALHDSLTGLPNRTLLNERLDRCIITAAASGTRFAVMIVDLDRFKAVNDSLGHHAGDELLRRISGRMLAVLEPRDTLARMGGDEFVVVREEITSNEEVEQLAVAIERAIAPSLNIEGTDLQISCSTGIALYPDAGRDAATLLRNADAAMYHGKNAGRHQYRFYVPQMGRFARERLEIESGLRRALAQEQFALVFQPRVDVKTGRICGAEALIRWHAPGRGVVPPTQFIPVAEETGLILPMGQWALRAATAQLRKWQDAGLGNLRISVNVSAEQLAHAELESVVMHALRESEIDPSLLELELTESAVMRDPERSEQVLRNLARRGISVSVDDFGTGYSSLSYLRRLPLHALKIDRSFIRDVVTNHEDAEITRAIISLAHSLKLKVTAEGVETERQLAFIRALGCDEYQGYLFSPAVDADEFAALGQPAAGRQLTGGATPRLTRERLRA